MAVKLDSKKMRAKLQEALKRYREAVDADQEERGLAIDDMVFAFSEDGQWDDFAKERRRNKPRYTINQVAAAINETVGNYRQNRIEMKARPEQDQSKDEANTYNGLIKSILAAQDAELAKDNAFKLIATSGIGAVRVLNKYTNSNPFEQDVCVEPIWDCLNTVWFDPFAKHPTAKDGRYVFETEQVDKEVFLERYPEAKLKSWTDTNVSKLQQGWGLDSTKDYVLVADYYVKEPIKVTKVLLSDGSIMVASDYENVADELIESGIEMIDARDVDTFKVMHYKMSGCEILEQPKELPTEHLPIVRALGYYEWMNGVLHYRGIVRPAKDPQRVYNYATSANIESVALSPKTKILATKKMIGNEIGTWRNANNSNSPVLIYEPDPSAPDGKPVPMNMNQGEPALVQQAQQAQLDLQSTIGRRSPAQQEAPADRSGRAILALQRQDDAVTFELLDNLAQTWEQVATIVMDMIPKVYDTERQVMILGDDDETEIVTINEIVVDEETGKEYCKNDVNKRYRIKASVGPAFETKRSEMVNVLSVMMQDPAVKPYVMDLFAKFMDFPFTDELRARFRKVQLAQGMVDPTDEEMEEMQRKAMTPEGQAQAQMQQMQQQLQMAAQQLAVERQQLENANLQANIANLQAATMEKFNNARNDAANIEETRADVIAKQIDSVVKQVEAGLMPSPAQLATIQQSIELLDATQQQEYQERVQQAVQMARNLQR